MSTFSASASFSRSSVTKSTSENYGADLSKHFRSELATLPDADESGLSASLGHPPFKPGRVKGVSELETPGSPRSLQQVQEDTLVVPTLRYAAGYRAPPGPVSLIPKLAGTDTELQSRDLVNTYPPSPLPIDPPLADNAESQTKEFRRRSRIHFATLCWSLFLEGWNDGSPGPLLPALQNAYNVLFLEMPSQLSRCLNNFDNFQVGFAVVSLFFVLSCVVTSPLTSLLDSMSDVFDSGLHRWSLHECLAK